MLPTLYWSDDCYNFCMAVKKANCFIWVKLIYAKDTGLSSFQFQHSCHIPLHYLQRFKLTPIILCPEGLLGVLSVELIHHNPQFPSSSSTPLLHTFALVEDVKHTGADIFFPFTICHCHTCWKLELYLVCVEQISPAGFLQIYPEMHNVWYKLQDQGCCQKYL